MLRIILTAAVAVLSLSPASAAWHKASSRHFIIYSEEEPENLRAFANKLERFDSAVRVLRKMKDPPVGDGNRLTVFVVRNNVQVEKLKRGGGRNVAGFYLPRVSGSIAVVPRATNGSLQPDVVFQHEYAHHLMFADLATPIPRWLVEGFAEFYSTANIEPDGSVGIGEAAAHRKGTFRHKIATMPLTSLLSGEIGGGFDQMAFYAQGWLLTHYLTFEPKRRGQLEIYLAEFARGRSSIDAARIAFGNLRDLEQDLTHYLRDEKFPYLNLPASEIKASEVQIERLGEGANAAMPLYMRLQSRTEGSAADNAAAARALAAVHPDDPLVMMTLAEAEWDARNFKAAEAAADKAIALQPQSAEAHIWKGRALLSQAEAGSTGVSFANARGWFNRANRLDPENPEPLFYYYRTFTGSGARPTANAIAALHYSAELAPHDLGLRLQSARQYLVDGKVGQARRMLIPVAYSPHGGKLADEAQELLQRIGTASGQN
ncbi:hypothetical protein G7076_03065 [Sphingomonas sp. HDW15A]|uniref:hypothetical protein n=1 Tax=Sphingomonas sp. HDW15A TaxID=2714942 RepID=UPI001407DEA3|nr:hypothetical protein [Sphingomonas sp. HDW15A]QIK95594.1 hypothetical protein G7076_03065 [Sphingomonas sp. HDW15A]